LQERCFQDRVEEQSAYSVEKLGFAGKLINSGQSAQVNSLFLLNIDFVEMPKFPRKGVFQQNRPIADAQLTVNL
jgi:hypothetical protein